VKELYGEAPGALDTETPSTEVLLEPGLDNLRRDHVE
jgi:hypothetical protein